MRLILFLLALSSFTSTAWSTIIHVPGDFLTIQEAIDAASPYSMDSVVVAPGTYCENIDFKGKNWCPRAESN